MKWTKLQPRIFYPASLSFRFDEETKNFRQAKAKRVQNHDTNCKRNVKGTLSKKGQATLET